MIALFGAAAAATGVAVGTEPWLGPVPEEQVRALVPADWTAVVLGQVSRGDRVVVVLWPAFRGRDLADDDVVGFSFAKSGEAWTAGDGNVLLSGTDGRGKLAGLLGGADGWTVRRACGADLDALGPAIQTRARAFVDAVDARQPKAAAQAFAAYAALLHEDAVLLSDAGIELARGFATTPLRCTAAMLGHQCTSGSPAFPPLTVLACDDRFAVVPPGVLPATRDPR